MNHCFYKAIGLFLLLISSTISMGQTNIQAGSSEYSIPVFSNTDSKSGLTHSVSISYSSGQGIKVGQLASNIGLGWNLNCGGEIIRVQNGIADDQYNPESIVNNLTDNDAGQFIYMQTNATLYDKFFPNGYLYKKYDINYIPRQLAYQPRFGNGEMFKYRMPPKVSEDTEQDVFIVNVNGIIKEFVIGRNFQVKFSDGSLVKVDILKEDNNDQTLYNQNILTKIKGFVLTDEQGVRYTFDKYDLEGQQEGIGIGWSAAKEEVSTGKFAINKWVLTSITEPVTNRSVTFEYETENWQYVTSISKSITRKYTGTGSIDFNGSTLISQANSVKQVIKKINYPGGESVIFNYSSASRVDLYGSRFLNNIQVYSGDQLLKNYSLNIGYFLDKNIVSSDGLAGDWNAVLTNGHFDQNKIFNTYKYRLALNSVTISNGNSKEDIKYDFGYYTGDDNNDPAIAVPSRMDMRKDYSGLYNKDINMIPTSSAYNGNLFNNDCAQLALLKTVKEGVNNQLTYQYKTWPTTTTNRNLVLVDKITSTDLVNNISYTKAYSYCYNSGLNYTCSNGGAYTAFVDVFPGPNLEQNTAGLLNQRFLLTYYDDTKKTVGQCILASAVKTAQGGVDFTNGVQQIAYSSAISVIKDMIPGGPIAQLSAYFVMNIITDILGNIFASNESTYDLEVTNDAAAFNTNPHPTMLARVVEFDLIDGAYYPSKEYQFNSTNTTSGNGISDVNIQPNIYPYPAKQRMDPGKVGNPTDIIYYNRSGQEVYRKDFTYDYRKTVLDDNFKSIKYGANRYYSAPYGGSPFSNGTITDSWISTASYNYVTGKAYPVQETEQVANTANTATATSSKFYSYNTKNNQLKQSYAVGSTGKLTGANTYYAVDYWDTYTSTSWLQNLKSSNIVNQTVAVLNWYKTSQSATNYYITGVVVSDYDATTLKPASTKTYRISQPIAITQSQLDNFDPFSGSSFIASLTADIAVSNVYKNSVLAEVWTNNNSSVSTIKYDDYLWLPIASINNSTSANSAYCSFENSYENGIELNKDGLTFSYSRVGYDKNAITGTNAYFFNSSNSAITKTNLNASLDYNVTLWVKNGSVTVNGSSGTLVATVDGWQLYRFLVHGTSTITIDSNAGSNVTEIDELRVLPTGASMSTKTYDPVTKLKISECDEANRMTYYEYDGWNRLKLIRDENKNVIKTYEYNIQK